MNGTDMYIEMVNKYLSNVNAKMEIDINGKETGNICYYANDGVLLAKFCPAFVDYCGRYFMPTLFFLTNNTLILDSNLPIVKSFKSKYKLECLKIVSIHSKVAIAATPII